MSRLAKTFLMLGIANLVASVPMLLDFVDVSKVPGWYVTFPTGAVCFGMFLLSWAFQKEVAAFDAEQQARHQSPSRTDSTRAKQSAQAPDDQVSVGA